MELFNTFVSEEAKSLAREVLDSGFLNQGKMVKQFEQELNKFGLVNPLTVNSCTSGLQIALECCNVREKEVILPAQTFIATGLAVLHAGGIPIFCDINTSGNINTDCIIDLITKKTAAIICVHWGGVPCDLEALSKIGKLYNIPIIEDAAHAFGAESQGKKIGSISDFTVFSFQSIKLLTTGDGGAICPKDPKYIDQIQKLKWFGINKDKMERNFEGDRKNDIAILGGKMHMNDLAAALGIGNIKHITSLLEKRRLIASIYKTEIKNVLHPEVIPYDNPSYWLYTIRVLDRKHLINTLRKNNIPCSVVDRRIDKNSIFNYKRNLPWQEAFDNSQLSIPCHESLKLEDIDKIVKVINSCV